MDAKDLIDRKMPLALEAMKKPAVPGELATDFKLYDEVGRTFDTNDDYLMGRPMVMAFAPARPDDDALAELKAFAGLSGEWRKYGVNAVLLSLETDNAALREMKERVGWPGSAISDPTGRIFAFYGLLKDKDIPGATGLRTIVITAQRRIGAVYDLGAHRDHARRALESVLRSSASEENFVADHAPVLIIPNVFSKPECDELVAYYERETHPVDFDRSNPATRDIDTKLPMWEHNRQDRIDLVVRHPVTLDILNKRIFSVVAPMVKKAFGYQANKRESVNIARYEGTRSGVIMGHRDNVQPEVSHRRFALTIALNDDYDGGGVVFREFSSHGYRGAPGTAFVFSSALLHEVQEVTRGRRYVMISHLYSDVAQR
ncbi:MAG: redoxin domain-containing protein [Parvularculaceae bacterium]